MNRAARLRTGPLPFDGSWALSGAFRGGRHGGQR